MTNNATRDTAILSSISGDIRSNFALNTNNKLGDGVAWNYNAGIENRSQGKTDTQNNIMKYITCYIWKRIT